MVTIGWKMCDIELQDVKSSSVWRQANITWKNLCTLLCVIWFLSELSVILVHHACCEIMTVK